MPRHVSEYFRPREPATSVTAETIVRRLQKHKLRVVEVRKFPCETEFSLIIAPADGSEAPTDGDVLPGTLLPEHICWGWPDSSRGSGFLNEKLIGGDKALLSLL